MFYTIKLPVRSAHRICGTKQTVRFEKEAVFQIVVDEENDSDPVMRIQKKSLVRTKHGIERKVIQTEVYSHKNKLYVPLRKEQAGIILPERPQLSDLTGILQETYMKSYVPEDFLAKTTSGTIELWSEMEAIEQWLHFMSTQYLIVNRVLYRACHVPVYQVRVQEPKKDLPGIVSLIATQKITPGEEYYSCFEQASALKRVEELKAQGYIVGHKDKIIIVDPKQKKLNNKE